ncbi:hypothetical protein TCAL_16677 [Tigriopus californicus]|uniref:Uncharacterized protein n=1 Tax=Tigriopus californicus TaxID=6832 RepID=A0A553PJD8_TIGCA|nr:hypothetical protein TCAL_16677 [Tigriopus californicus]
MTLDSAPQHIMSSTLNSSGSSRRKLRCKEGPKSGTPLFGVWKPGSNHYMVQTDSHHWKHCASRPSSIPSGAIPWVPFGPIRSHSAIWGKTKCNGIHLSVKLQVINDLPTYLS